MKALIFLGAALMLLLPKTSSAESSPSLADEWQSTLSQIEMTKGKLERLQSLAESLAAQQTSYAGYGFPRTSPDLERVRSALFEAKAHYNNLVARKVYLQHRIDTEGPEHSATHYDQEMVEEAPTQAPENCPHGAVNMRNQWHCVRKESKALPNPKRKLAAEECEIGTVEIHGKSYCLGKEPGGPLVREASNEFLGALIAAPQSAEQDAVPAEPYPQPYR